MCLVKDNSNLLPSPLDNINNNPVVLTLLQPTDNHNSNHALDALHPNRHGTTVDRIPGRLLGAHAVLGPEQLLVSVELAVQEPGAAAEPQDSVALPPDPILVVRHSSRADGALEEDLRRVGKRNGDDSWFSLRREGEEAGPKEGAEAPGVFGGELVKGEGVAVCF